MIDYFQEEVELTVVLNNLDPTITLNDCKEELLKSEKFYLKILVNLLNGLIDRHKSNFYYPNGYLNEFNIYKESETDSNFLIDQQIFSNRVYLNILPPEFDSEKDFVASEKTDVFQLGLIFIRFMTSIVIFKIFLI